ncbi:hypothetical protein K5I29_11065 [Flavobacterium agricola]|uniref:Uncharacterized protein n=1 Tax=Flavobacterium agricola TaxID=2870839 RepID=A0ABY6LXF9_9FLAO|nr:hypothetical protein [Flavobacterium agricola]UYW01023.1 hypothetical protein K5I29_11065 [Flavobacterium agricola]
MNRFLISQKETNIGYDYCIIDGKLTTDEFEIIKCSDYIFEADEWKNLYKDDKITIKSSDKIIFIKSHYLDKDNADRAINYIFYINQEDSDWDTIVKKLENDSELIDRNLDKEHLKQVIAKLSNNKIIKKKILLFLLAIGAIIILTKMLKN